MKSKQLLIALIILTIISLFMLESAPLADNMPANGGYPCKDNLIEVMFTQESAVRLRDGKLVDLSAAKAISGIDEVLTNVEPFTWRRVCDVSEKELDALQQRGELNTGQPVYNLNNIYRLRIPEGNDIWALCAELEALPGIISARPMPLPMPLPSIQPPDYEYLQGYLLPANAIPTGLDFYYAWGQWGGYGSGVQVCDIEYSWYNHNDINQLPGSQINPYQLYDPFPAQRAFHGTAVAGMLAADNNLIGTRGMCPAATLLTCGSSFIVPNVPPDTLWDVPAAIIMAANVMSAGDVILLEQQWDYNDPTTGYTDYIPIEWWTSYYPNAQGYNAVYAAITAAVAAGIHVVEAGGNGGAPTLSSGYNTDLLSWYPQNSGAIIVGAGGVYAGGTWNEGNLERISWSSYGSRYNLQGWGEDVATTAYGDLDSTYGYFWMYTNSFSGTSSASPCVAAAMACCVSYWVSQGQSASSLTPAMLRDVLVTTGTAQITPPSGNIGPRPNLQAAIDALTVDWTDVTTPLLNNSGMAGIGAAWGDYDGDYRIDLYVTNDNANPNLLCNNTITGFVDASAPPMNNSLHGNCSVWGDFDNDGRLDLYLNNNGGPNFLFQNMGMGTFADVTVYPLDALGTGAHANWVDYDNDGDVDLYVTNSLSPNRLIRNDGGGSWTDITGTPVNYVGHSAGSAWGDYDNDGDADLYLACYSGESNHLYRNDGGGIFVDVTAPPLDDNGEGFAPDWGDFDNDGDLDLYLVNNGGMSNKLFENKGTHFGDATIFPIDDPNWGISGGWADYDNDGDLDLYVTNSFNKNKLFRNDGGYVFTDQTFAVIDDTAEYNMGFAWGDYDNDGDLDLYVTGYAAPGSHLYRNEIGQNNNWIKIELSGNISNKMGIGARVRVVTGSLSQIREVTSGSGYASMHSLTADFGLGSATVVDSLIVQWPSGVVQSFTMLAANNWYMVGESFAVCGDANGDGQVNVGDAVYVIAYVFKGGPAPNPVCAGDANHDGQCNVGDAVYLIAYVFKGGPPPVAGCCP